MKKERKTLFFYDIYMCRIAIKYMYIKKVKSKKKKKKEERKMIQKVLKKKKIASR